MEDLVDHGAAGPLLIGHVASLSIGVLFNHKLLTPFGFKNYVFIVILKLLTITSSHAENSCNECDGNFSNKQKEIGHIEMMSNANF